MWRVRADTLPEKVNIWRGKIWSRPFFWEDLPRDDLTARLTRFERPVYFFTGRQDYTANAEPSRAAPLSVSLSRPTSSHMGRSVWCPALVYGSRAGAGAPFPRAAKAGHGPRAAPTMGGDPE